jgi:hypothetical protein
MPAPAWLTPGKRSCSLNFFNQIWQQDNCLLYSFKGLDLFALKTVNHACLFAVVYMDMPML